MKTWSLLAGVAGLLLLTGFTLLAFPPLPARSLPRTGLSVSGAEAPESLSSRAARRHRQVEQSSWRHYFIQ